MKQFDYDMGEERGRLDAIRGRYGSAGGDLCHFPDCSVHRPLDVYGTAACTCGLLHDLAALPVGILAKVRPGYFEEVKLEDGISQERVFSGKERTEALALFGEYEGPLPPLPERELLGVREWQVIEEVFGTDFRMRREVEWAAGVS